MLSVITKEEYWKWCDAGATASGKGVLKDIQDSFALFHLGGLSGARVCEVGGGNSRVLPKLVASNECWNLDKFEGQGGGPSVVAERPGIRLSRVFIGEFSPEIPDDYFDVVFSVSVVEHIPSNVYADAIRDCVRVLKKGGRLLHAIDVYLPDAGDNSPAFAPLRARLDLYLKTVELSEGRLAWAEPPAIDVNLGASAKHACNQVDELYKWNKMFPQLRGMREVAASCSLQMILERKT